MTTIFAYYDFEIQFLLGGILGAIGQGIRITIGLKKLYKIRANFDESKGFSNKWLLLSIFIGFTTGALTIMAIRPDNNEFTMQLIATIIASGYIGADFIEGIFITRFTKNNPNQSSLNSSAAASEK